IGRRHEVRTGLFVGLGDYEHHEAHRRLSCGVLWTRRTRGSEIDTFPPPSPPSPPASAPTTRKGSVPLVTASGRGASGRVRDRSRAHAKNRTNGRRSRVTWSRMVPRSIG